MEETQLIESLKRDNEKLMLNNEQLARENQVLRQELDMTRAERQQAMRLYAQARGVIMALLPPVEQRE